MQEVRKSNSHKKAIPVAQRCDLESATPIAVTSAITHLLVQNAILNAKYPQDTSNIKIGGNTAKVNYTITNSDQTSTSSYHYKYVVYGSERSTTFELSFQDFELLKNKADISIKFWLWLIICLNDVKHNKTDYIGFSLEDLVSKGMYGSVDSARLGLKTAWKILPHLKIKSILKWDGINEIKQDELAPLFLSLDIKGNYCKVSINKNFNLDIFRNFYTHIPGHILMLSTRTIVVLSCISYFIRKNKTRVYNGDIINIPLRNIYIWGLLPSEEGSTKDTFNKIKKPLKKIIDEIASLKDYEVELHISPDKRIADYLDKGYISIKVTNPTILKSINKVEDSRINYNLQQPEYIN